MARPTEAGFDPLLGFTPRRVSATQVQSVMVYFQKYLSHIDLTDHAHVLSFQEGSINPFTQRKLSPQYKNILATRRKLPVYARMDEFYQLVSRFATGYFHSSEDGQ